MSSKFRFFYVELDRKGNSACATKYPREFPARNETEAGAELVAFCSEGDRAYAENTFEIFKDGAWVKLRDPNFPARQRAA